MNVFVGISAADMHLDDLELKEQGYCPAVSSNIYWIRDINTYRAKLNNLNFQPLEVVSRSATHNFKWLKIADICLILHQTFANLVV